MANFIFDYSKGYFKFYVNQSAPAGLVAVLFQAAGGSIILDADSAMVKYQSLAALIGHASGSTNANSNVEATFTNYARQVLTTVTGTVDTTNNEYDVTADSITWATAGGTTNNTIGKCVICYCPNTGTELTGSDTLLIPISAHDVNQTTNGTDLVAQIASPGFASALAPSGGV